MRVRQRLCSQFAGAIALVMVPMSAAVSAPFHQRLPKTSGWQVADGPPLAAAELRRLYPFAAKGTRIGSIRVGSSFPRPEIFTRFETGHIRRRSLGAGRNTSVPASPESHAS